MDFRRNNASPSSAVVARAYLVDSWRINFDEYLRPSADRTPHSMAPQVLGAGASCEDDVRLHSNYYGICRDGLSSLHAVVGDFADGRGMAYRSIFSSRRAAPLATKSVRSESSPHLVVASQINAAVKNRPAKCLYSKATNVEQAPKTISTAIHRRYRGILLSDMREIVANIRYSYNLMLGQTRLVGP
jgi:hypothetical protein